MVLASWRGRRNVLENCPECRRSWGMRLVALKILYRGSFVAAITYGAGCWVDRLNTYVACSILLREQRSFLIRLIKAYRSVSTAALPVLAKILPADFEMARAGRLDLARP
ncbi:Retrovirus-related Pol polyprotein from type-1 retrotransposable element R1 [Eumeta japonica]|uniref:Retrovirus-related Pol polyprotein from type-1 retrotransposable element R1 n=1 Tax=Eumeta variegata TaxID=151549 RepID=A0A4C1ZWS5_EUMVA|nr:Retrovirus-related Pol polyprotein from type-1 retrotransposable element R1 [Eumeta japonica]